MKLIPDDGQPQLQPTMAATAATDSRNCSQTLPPLRRSYQWILAAHRMRIGDHDIFHVLLQEPQTRFLLLLWFGAHEVRAVHHIASNCQPLLFIKICELAHVLLAFLSALKDDYLPCATEVPTDVNVLCFAIACERIQWVVIWQTHSATAELVAEPSH